MGAQQLVERFPGLERRLPMVRLGRFPTPVEEAGELAKALALTALWVKRDDRSGELYGGNKVRKLELLLGRARADHRGWVATAGAWGSHHVLATTLLSRSLGIRVAAVLCPQPPTAHVRETLLCTHGSGAAIVAVPSPFAVPPVLAAEAVRRRAMLIPPGGSSPLGALAFAGAALELAAQVAAGDCPAPERIYVALGSSGTMAGLLVGAALAGLETEIVGVRVTERYMTGEAIVAGLANRAAGLLRRLAPTAPALRFARHSVTVLHDQIGEGYGHPTDRAGEAEALAREHAGLTLDPTYTAKAMAGLIADIRRRPPAGPILFWSTLSSVDLGDLLARCSPAGLPKALRQLYR
jgi:1-aminocyclopropane-1-carboxylate deaminase/D-cysteine desulfhydrase-like pyridoxal-dependent ACC family enzyme